MKLSSNFSLSEFKKSQYATRHDIKNEPDALQIVNLKNLCLNILQPLRNWYKKPITISSGFRCLELNTEIGGSTTSQHCKGMAADIDTVNDNADLFFHIRHNYVFDQLIWEFGTHKNPAWVHVSFRSDGKNRGEVLRAEKKNGKTIYTKMV